MHLQRMTGFYRQKNLTKGNFYNFDDENGELPERSIGAVSKTVVLLRVPRVRIPHSPLITLKQRKSDEYIKKSRQLLKIK